MIKNGLAILGVGEVITGVAAQGGKIVAIGQDLSGERVIDAAGLVVSPGMVDAHVHITDPGDGYRNEWGGYVTGTAACARGGITIFMEMPLNRIPATVDKTSLEIRYKAGENKPKVDVGSFGDMIPTNLADGIQELDEGDISGYKYFLGTCGNRSIEGDFQNVDDYSLYEGMKQVAKTGKVLVIHAENAPITDKLGAVAYQNGETTLAAYVTTRPVSTKVEAIQKAILFAKETDCRIYICHVACQEGVEEALEAQAERVDVICETCTRYLYFTTDELDVIDPVVKCSPPTRDVDRQAALWSHMQTGGIVFVTSDHSLCTPDLKDTINAFRAWGGTSGVQNNADVLFDEAIQKRGLSLKQFTDMIAANPTDRYHLAQKGRISIGKDADFILIKPNAPYILKAEDLEYRSKVSPYIGREVGAQVIQTILRGETIYAQETGVTEALNGAFIKN